MHHYPTCGGSGGGRDLKEHFGWCSDAKKLGSKADSPILFGYDPALSTPLGRLTSMLTVHNLNYGGTEMCEERERDYQLFEAAVFNRKTGHIIVATTLMCEKTREAAQRKALVDNASDLRDLDQDDLVVAVRPFV